MNESPEKALLHEGLHACNKNYMRVKAELDEMRTRYCLLRGLAAKALRWGLNPPDEARDGYDAIEATETGRLLHQHLQRPIDDAVTPST